jgi:prepilin-type N-terminal cleavage/methylation domain-containing protein
MLTNPLSKLPRTPEAGFSVLELLIVIVIIGILAAVAVPIFLNQQKAAELGELKGNLVQASMNVETAKHDNGGLYPTNYVADNLLDVKTKAFIYSYSVNQFEDCLEATATDGTHWFVSNTNKVATTTSCQQAITVPNPYAVTK